MGDSRAIVDSAKEKAMRWCSRREYFRKEMFEKIISWGCTPQDAHTVVDFLVEQRFIDDVRCAEAYVRDKLRFNGWGRIKIAYMLRMQGIDASAVHHALSGIDEHQYENLLKAELTKKHKTVRGETTVAVKGKLFRFAAGRGFEPDVINKVIHQIQLK
jgi:regulatory protein